MEWHPSIRVLDLDLSPLLEQQFPDRQVAVSRCNVELQEIPNINLKLKLNLVYSQFIPKWSNSGAAHQSYSIFILGVQVGSTQHHRPDISQHRRLFCPSTFIDLLLRDPCVHTNRKWANNRCVALPSGPSAVCGWWH